MAFHLITVGLDNKNACFHTDFCRFTTCRRRGVVRDFDVGRRITTRCRESVNFSLSVGLCGGVYICSVRDQKLLADEPVVRAEPEASPAHLGPECDGPDFGGRPYT